jgi:hypothetical protein
MEKEAGDRRRGGGIKLQIIDGVTGFGPFSRGRGDLIIAQLLRTVNCASAWAKTVISTSGKTS